MFDEEDKPSLAKQMGLLDRKPGYVQKNSPPVPKNSPSVLKFPIGHEPPPPEDEQPHEKKKASAKTPESLLLRSYSATVSTDGDLKSLSQVLSQEAKKPISQSAIIRALIATAAHDPTSIPKLLSYVLHKDITWGHK